MHGPIDHFGAKSVIKSKAGDISYYRLDKLSQFGSLSRLPFSLRILLESALRNFDNFAFTEDHLKQIISWKPGKD